MFMSIESVSIDTQNAILGSNHDLDARKFLSKSRLN